jgi:hypothetical protein
MWGLDVLTYAALPPGEDGEAPAVVVKGGDANTRGAKTETSARGGNTGRRGYSGNEAGECFLVLLPSDVSCLFCLFCSLFAVFLQDPCAFPCSSRFLSEIHLAIGKRVRNFCLSETSPKMRGMKLDQPRLAFGDPEPARISVLVKPS